MQAPVGNSLPLMKTSLKSIYVTATHLNISWVLTLIENNRYLTAGYFTDVALVVTRNDGSCLEKIAKYLEDPAKYRLCETSKYLGTRCASVEFSGANFLVEDVLFRR